MMFSNNSAHDISKMVRQTIHGFEMTCTYGISSIPKSSNFRRAELI